MHVDSTVLADGDAAGRSEIQNGPNVSAETCRRLSCDCSVVEMIHGSDGAVLDVGRKTRAISPALWRALEARDGVCQFPGCDCRYNLRGHHVVHWADGGKTGLSNVIQLCSQHHRLVHEGGFSVRAQADGTFEFLDPASRSIPATGLLPACTVAPLDAFRVRHTAQGIELTCETGFPTWGGEVMDYDWAIQSLMHLQEGAPIYSDGQPTDPILLHRAGLTAPA